MMRTKRAFSTAFRGKAGHPRRPLTELATSRRCRPTEWTPTSTPGDWPTSADSLAGLLAGQDSPGSRSRRERISQEPEGRLCVWLFYSQPGTEQPPSTLSTYIGVATK